MTQYVDNTWLATETCCSCGMLFAVPSDFQARRKDDHKSFYCPSGHCQSYTGATEAMKLRKELDAKERDLRNATARALTAESERRQIAKAHDKMRKRIVNGVCPCCNRSFENLRMHMQTEHADFGTPSTLLALRTAFGMTQDQVAREAGTVAPYVSNYERGKPVSAEAKQCLDRWLESHEAAA